MGWKALRNVVVACLVATIGVPAMAQIAPEAYWRHEEGPAGSDVSTNGDTVLDSSGNGNHMRTFSQFTGATYTTDVPPIPLRSGLPNTLALKLDRDEDGAGPDLNDDNYPDLQAIEVTLFAASDEHCVGDLSPADGPPSATLPTPCRADRT